MVLSSYWSVFLVGLLGGAMAELLHWWNLRLQAVLPEYAKHTRYWAITALMAAAGGLVSLLYFGARADAVLALHIGAATPLLLQKLVTSVPETGGSRAPAKIGPTVRSFFRW